MQYVNILLNPEAQIKEKGMKYDKKSAGLAGPVEQARRGEEEEEHREEHHVGQHVLLRDAEDLPVRHVPGLR